MFLFAISEKIIPCMQVNFSWSWVERVNPLTHVTTCLIEGKIFAFLGGSWAGFLEGLCNFWVEQLTTAQNCAISGMICPTGRNCAIFPVNSNRQICAILEPNKLPDKIAQFLEGRLVPLQNCAIS